MSKETMTTQKHLTLDCRITIEKGLDKILKKVIEEAGEILMASKDGNKLQIIKEIAEKHGGDYKASSENGIYTTHTTLRNIEAHI